MTSGQINGDRQHRLVFKIEQLKPQETGTSSCYRQEPKDLTTILFFFQLRFASSHTQLTERDGRCTQNHLTGRAHTHIFLVRTPQRIIRTFPVWAHHIGSR